MSEKKIPMGMTVEEFEEHLKMMNDRVINFKDYGGSGVNKKLEKTGRVEFTKVSTGDGKQVNKIL